MASHRFVIEGDGVRIIDYGRIAEVRNPKVISSEAITPEPGIGGVVTIRDDVYLRTGRAAAWRQFKNGVVMSQGRTWDEIRDLGTAVIVHAGE